MKLRYFGRVGRIYNTWQAGQRTHECYEYPCTFGLSHCCHQDCRLEALRAAGYNTAADRLEANWQAKDWLKNWGRMVYDPQDHGRDPKRRNMAAAFIRRLRNRHLGYADACVGGAWTGALMDRPATKEVNNG